MCRLEWGVSSEEDSSAMGRNVMSFIFLCFLLVNGIISTSAPFRILALPSAFTFTLWITDRCSTSHSHWLPSLTDPQVQRQPQPIIDLIISFFQKVSRVPEVCFVVLCLRVRLSVSQPVQVVDSNLWSSCMASPIWCGSTPDQGRQAVIKFSPTLFYVLTIGLKNICRLAGTSASWVSMSVIVGVVGYYFGCRLIMAVIMNLSAVLMIWVFSSLCSRLADWQMLSQNTVCAIFEREHVYPSCVIIWCSNSQSVSSGGL